MLKFVILLLIAPKIFALNYFPRKDITAGSFCTATSSDFREYRYAENIPVCKRNVRSSLKRRVYEAYNIPVRERSKYTVDHLIGLFNAGSNKFDNLWPQLKSMSTSRFEQKIYNMLKLGRISHEESIWFMRDRKFKK